MTNLTYPLRGKHLLRSRAQTRAVRLNNRMQDAIVLGSEVREGWLRRAGIPLWVTRFEAVKAGTARYQVVGKGEQ